MSLLESYLWWQENLREGIHGPLHRVAREAWDCVQCCCHQLCSSCKARKVALGVWIISASFNHQQPDLFLLEPGLITGLARFGWVGDDVHARLPEHSGAELGADRLLQQSHHVVVHVHHLGVTTPEKKV